MEVLLLAFSFVAILGIGYRVHKSPGGTPARWIALVVAAACTLAVLWSSGREIIAGRDTPPAHAAYR